MVDKEKRKAQQPKPASASPKNDEFASFKKLAKQLVNVSKEEAYKRVDGYQADLKYPLQNRTWPAQRMGSKIPINGEEYKIVAINQREVILSAPNEKKWTIKAMAKAE